MSSLDHLPADQGAVLSLVLQRGRGYDEIATLLGIDRAAVRQRALDGFDTLGPSTSVPASERALLTDYLLGQLPPRVADSVRDGIAASPAQRAWVRVIASEIGSLSLNPLPEIPAAASAASVIDGPVGVTGEPDEYTPRERTPRREREREAAPRGERAPRQPRQPREPRQPRAARSGNDRPEGSRRGGAVVLGIVAAVVVVVVVIVVVSSGGGKNSPSNLGTGNNAADTGTTTTSSGTTTNPLQKLAAFDLTSPTSGSKAIGIAEVAREVADGKSTTGVVIIASGLPANPAHHAYGVWLYSSPTHEDFLGYYNQSVPATGKDKGRLEVTALLKPGYLSYSTLLVTLETEGTKLTTPGTIELQGTVK
jgi:hypothetical protein